MRELSASARLWLAGIVAAPILGVAQFSDALSGDYTRQLLAPPAEVAGVGGHPRFVAPIGAPGPSPLPAVVEAGATPPLPVLSPLATGRFVNFESPAIDALALHPDGDLMVAVDTPGNSLLVLDPTAAAGFPRIVDTIPVGLEPASVAFQPGTPAVAWVTNFVSDDVSVVDVAARRVLAVIPVGDEPTVVRFHPAGGYAYVVTQGRAAGGPVAPVDHRGHVVTIDTATHSVVAALPLDMNHPRCAVLDPLTDRLIVAALHGGNNTSAAGEPIVLVLDDSVDPPLTQTRHSLDLLQSFSVSATAFADSGLGPWPDSGATPGAPQVSRIVADDRGGWTAIVARLTTPAGAVDPAVAAAFAAEFGALNATAALQRIVDDVKDTLDHDLALLDLSDPAQPSVHDYVGGVGTTLSGMALDPTAARVFVSNMEPHNLRRTAQQLQGNLVDHEVVMVTLGPQPDVVARNLHAGVNGFGDPPPTGDPAARDASLANPVALAFRADGSRAYVAALGPGRVGVLDGATGRVLGRVDAGRGARALALDEPRDRLYVYNRTDHSIATVDVSSDNPVLLHTVYPFNPEPVEIRNGRDFHYSTRFSPNFASACATCHIDATLDHLAWDLGDTTAGPEPIPSNLVDPNGPPLSNHPLKGPMVTLSLRGLKDHNSFHWRGDRPDLPAFNGTFDKLFGGSELPDDDIAALSAFIETLVYPPNPFMDRDNSFLDADAWPGATLYVQNCHGCHSVFQDGALRLAGLDDDAGIQLGGIFAQIQLITQLRGLHKKFDSDRYGGFGLVHDGREEREQNGHPLQTFLLTFFPGLDPQERQELIAFVTAFPTNVMPVVGWQAPAAAGSVDTARGLVDAMIAQRRQAPSHCDVVARGALGGVATGWLLLPGAPGDPAVFESDFGDQRPLDELLAALDGPDQLVFMAVPPGSGRRIALDYDSDCIPNGLDAFPRGSANFDGDADVGLNDLLILLAHFGETPAPRAHGDADGDGEVGLDDLLLLLAAFGTHCPYE